jgi:serine/threonine protein kinase
VEKASVSGSQLPTARIGAGTDGRTAATTPADRARGQRGAALVLGRYRLYRRLGAGGFGTVWMARDERLERDVAVKIVPRERIVGGRFEREARAAARLSHPGIVTLYEAAVDDDGAYLVSELVRGQTLAVLLEEGRLSDRDIVEIAIALCEALAHAHANGVVHRDVKPSNVLIADHPSTPAQLAKLTDFGVARVIGGDSLTRTGDVLGTVAYMAPEQAEGLDAGAPADLYSLALVIYEALTGVNPVRTGTAAQRARRLGAHLPPLRRQRRDLPRELGRGIDLALRPRPRERGTTEELRAALTEALPVLQDTPGVVSSPWAPRTQPAQAEQAIDRARWSADAQQPAADDAPDASTAPSRLARGLAALAAAAMIGWLTAHVLSPPPISPAAAALLAAVLIAAVPRVGWLVLTAALVLASALEHRPGAALLIGLAAGVPVLLLPRSGPAWTLPAGAPTLGLLGVGGAWPALASRAVGPWRRAVLGATGWIWLVAAAPLAGKGLYLKQLPGTPSLHDWSASVHGTVTLVLRPILSSGALAGAPVWALAAVALPWLVRRRSLAVDFVLVTAWAAAAVSATGTAIAMVHPSSGLLGQQSAVIGGIASAMVALAPSIRDAVRTGSARARFP